MTTMRAKMQVTKVESYHSHNGELQQQSLTLNAVGLSTLYPEGGADEDNTFARYTPAAELKISILNPVLFDKLPLGARFYVDFTPVP
jgi:hypothetical protein